MPKVFGVDLPDVSRTVGLLLFSVAFFLVLHWVPQLAREQAEQEVVQMRAASREAVQLAVHRAREADPAAWARFQQWQEADDAHQFATFQEWKDAHAPASLVSLTK
jgi:hypothetical protein